MDLLLERNRILQQEQVNLSVSKNLPQYEHHFWPVEYLLVPRSDLYCMHILLHCVTDVQKFSFIYWFDSSLDGSGVDSSFHFLISLNANRVAHKSFYDFVRTHCDFKTDLPELPPWFLLVYFYNFTHSINQFCSSSTIPIYFFWFLIF